MNRRVRIARFVGLNRLPLLAAVIVGCSKSPENACPATIAVQVDTAAAVSSWGGAKPMAAAALNQAVAECFPLRFTEGPAMGRIRSYRFPVSVTVRSAVVDTARYNAAIATGGLSGSIRFEAMGKSGVVLETTTAPYHFAESQTGTQVSDAILITPDEMSHVVHLRANWVFTR